MTSDKRMKAFLFLKGWTHGPHNLDGWFYNIEYDTNDDYYTYFNLNEAYLLETSQFRKIKDFIFKRTYFDKPKFEKLAQLLIRILAVLEI